ncbi:hypothetical protein B0G38_004381 [Arthrobacter sp. VKM Ac-2550]|nr:hypothetical protein [Arthrobacter sp. VKM Ac-2550]
MMVSSVSPEVSPGRSPSRAPEAAATKRTTLVGSWGSGSAICLWLLQHVVLEPGDRLNTGTPEGVAMTGRFPYLQEGDTLKRAGVILGEQESKVHQHDLVVPKNS